MEEDKVALQRRNANIWTFSESCAAPFSFLEGRKVGTKHKIRKHRAQRVKAWVGLWVSQFPATWVRGEATKVSFPSEGSSLYDDRNCPCFALIRRRNTLERMTRIVLFSGQTERKLPWLNAMQGNSPQRFEGQLGTPLLEYGRFSLRSPSSLPQAHRCLSSLQSPWGSKSP
jgi:hypothetical protein